MLSDRQSVRWRVTSSASLVLTLTLVVAAFSAAGLLRRALTSDEEAVLVDRVNEVEELIDAGGLTPLLEPTGQKLGQVQVIDAQGVVVAMTPGLADTVHLDLVAAPPAGRQTSSDVGSKVIGGPVDAQYRVVARTVAAASGPLTIYAFSSNSAAHRAERYLRNSMLFALPLFVVLTAWFISRVVKWALAPVEAMRVEVERIEATELSARVDAGGSDDEIARLGATLNRMLGRLQDAATGQELFAASASHELRSPLSAIRTELEVGLAYPDRAEWVRIAEDSLIEVARLETLSRDLRTLTRSRTVVKSTAQRFDLAELIAAEVVHRRPSHPIHLNSVPAVAEVHADRDGVVQVLRNLLDNAERHAASEIRVDVRSAPSGVTLTVANDGEQIPGAMRERIFDAFQRLDEARALDTGGSGLGLAIARTVMQANSGTLVAVEVEHGAEFRAWFPAPPPSS